MPLPWEGRKEEEVQKTPEDQAIEQLIPHIRDRLKALSHSSLQRLAADSSQQSGLQNHWSSGAARRTSIDAQLAAWFSAIF